MSVKLTTTKWGDKTIKRVRLTKGYKIEDDKGTTIIEEDCYVDVEYTWRQDPRWAILNKDGAWREPRYLWNTLRPVGAPMPEQPDPKPVKLPFWRRWFGSKIPKAQVVEK